MSTSSRGIGAENYVASVMEEMGYVVASRRHRKGGGDLLGAWGGKDGNAPLGFVPLVEVKARPRESLYSGAGFSKTQRQEMLATPLPLGGKRWVARVEGSGKKRRVEWIVASEWPKSKSLS